MAANIRIVEAHTSRARRFHVLGVVGGAERYLCAVSSPKAARRVALLTEVAQKGRDATHAGKRAA